MSEPAELQTRPRRSGVILLAILFVEVATFLFLKWLWVGAVVVHSWVVLLLGLVIVATSGFFLGRRLGVARDKSMVTGGALALVLLLHGAVAPWGYELERMAAQLPVPDGYTTTFTDRHAGIPVCIESCPFGRVRGYYPPPGNVSLFVQQFLDETLPAMESSGWELVSMQAHSLTSTMPQPCTSHCGLEWKRDDLSAHIYVGEGEAVGNIPRPPGAVPIEIVLMG